MALCAFGGGLKEARESGASRQQQFNYALSSAAVEVLTEKIGSIALPLKGAYGKGAVDDIVRDFVNGAAKTPLGRAGLNTLFSALSEGGEEIVSDIVNPIIKTATFDREGYKEYGSPEYWSEMLRDGIIGAGLGLVGNGGQVEHIIKRHGKNGNADKSMRDMNDLGRIQYVLDNYDSVSDGGRSEAYSTNKPVGNAGQLKRSFSRKP